MNIDIVMEHNLDDGAVSVTPLWAARVRRGALPRHPPALGAARLPGGGAGRLFPGKRAHGMQDLRGGADAGQPRTGAAGKLIAKTLQAHLLPKIHKEAQRP